MDVTFQVRHDHPFNNFDHEFKGSDQRNQSYLDVVRDHLHLLARGTAEVRIHAFHEMPEVDTGVLCVVQLASHANVQRKFTITGSLRDVARLGLLYAYWQVLYTSTDWPGSYDLWVRFVNSDDANERVPPQQLLGSTVKNAAEATKIAMLRTLGIRPTPERLRVSILNLPELLQ